MEKPIHIEPAPEPGPNRQSRRALASIRRRLQEELTKPKPNQTKLGELWRKAQALGVSE